MPLTDEGLSGKVALVLNAIHHRCWEGTLEVPWELSALLRRGRALCHHEPVQQRAAGFAHTAQSGEDESQLRKWGSYGFKQGLSGGNHTGIEAVFWGPLPCPALPWGCCPAGRFMRPAWRQMSNRCLVQRPHAGRSSTFVRAGSTTSGGLSLLARSGWGSAAMSPGRWARKEGWGGIGKESCKAGSYTKPGWEEWCVQRDRCRQLSGRMTTSSIFEAASGGPEWNLFPNWRHGHIFWLLGLFFSLIMFPADNTVQLSSHLLKESICLHDHSFCPWIITQKGCSAVGTGRGIG